eukprot:7636690-Pyramimonas_sp.AAC.1
MIRGYYITTTATTKTRAPLRLLHYHITASSTGHRQCCYYYPGSTSTRPLRYYTTIPTANTRQRYNSRGPPLQCDLHRTTVVEYFYIARWRTTTNTLVGSCHYQHVITIVQRLHCQRAVSTYDHIQHSEYDYTTSAKPHYFYSAAVVRLQYQEY